MGTPVPPVELRRATLYRLEALLTLLVKRHGGRTTLAELLCLVASLARLCDRKQVSVAEIAAATGLPKQSLSRWMRKRVGRSIVLQPNPQDQRVQDISLLDPAIGREHYREVARLLGLG